VKGTDPAAGRARHDGVEHLERPLNGGDSPADARRLLGEQVRSPLRALFGAEPILDVVRAVSGQIEARILIVPADEPMRYTLMQTYEPGLVTRLDIAAFPRLNHSCAYERYRASLGLEHKSHYVTGGRIDLGANGVVMLFDTSSTYGSSLAGFDANAIAAALLKLSAHERLSAPRACPSAQRIGSLKTSPDEFFSLWIELFASSAAEAPHAPLERFLERAAALHRAATSTPLDEQMEAERALRRLLLQPPAARTG